MSDARDRILKFLEKTDTNIELETAMEETSKKIPKFDNKKKCYGIYKR